MSWIKQQKHFVKKINNDICTTLLKQLLRQFCYFLFSLVKNNKERKMKRDNKNEIWVYERKLFKSCTIIIFKKNTIISH